MYQRGFVPSIGQLMGTQRRSIALQGLVTCSSLYLSLSLSMHVNIASEDKLQGHHTATRECEYPI